MDVMEKLIELMIEAKKADTEDAPFSEFLADFMVANGVTVQECGRWKYYNKHNKDVCTICSFERDLDANFGKAISCPNCGAYMS